MPPRAQPDSCYAARCPLAGKAKGFALGSGDPQRARLAFNFEALGSEEVSFEVMPRAGEYRRFLATPAEGQQELEIRRRDYPEMAEEFRRKGVPVVGTTGHILFDWVCANLGVRRSADIFIDNTLRCLPPKRKGSDEHYPTGDERKQAERCCRQYDRWSAMRPDVAVITLHPASIARDTTPLPLVVEDLKKARDFAAAGHGVVVLAGGKAVKLWLGARDNTTFWRGDYAPLGPQGVPRVSFVAVSEEDAAALASGKPKRKGGAKGGAKLSAEEKRERAKSRRRGKSNFLKGTVLDLTGGTTA